MLLCDLDGEKMSDKMDLVDLMPGEFSWEVLLPLCRLECGKLTA